MKPAAGELQVGQPSRPAGYSLLFLLFLCFLFNFLLYVLFLFVLQTISNIYYIKIYCIKNVKSK